MNKEYEIKKKIIKLQEDYKKSMNNIEEGQCVMCGEEGECITDKTNELLCLYCWGVNEELLAKKRGDRIIKLR